MRWPQRSRRPPQVRARAAARPRTTVRTTARRAAPPSSTEGFTKRGRPERGRPPEIAPIDQDPPRVGRWSLMSDLALRQCVPCKGGTPPLRGPELDDLLAQLGNDWRVVDEHHLEKEFRFANFREALDFTNRVGELAEEQGHHPDIHLA